MPRQSDDDWLLADVCGERLRRLIPKIWNCLPIRDKAMLRRNVVIVEDAGGLGRSELAGTRWDETLGQEGLGGYEIKFYPSVSGNDEYSDQFVRFLIAHEFAHAILRHWHISAIVCHLKAPEYSREIANVQDALWRIQEDHANAQVAEWGFEDELRAQRQHAEDLANQHEEARQAIPLCSDFLIRRAAKMKQASIRKKQTARYLGLFPHLKR